MPSSGSSWFSVFSNPAFWNPSSCISVELATITSSVPRRSAPTRVYLAAKRPAASLPRRLVGPGALHAGVAPPGHQLRQDVADRLRASMHGSGFGVQGSVWDFSELLR